METPPIRTERNYRFLKALIKHGKLGVRELENLVFCNHSPAEKRALRKLGWCIEREIITVTDRDGKRCRPSLYYLPEDWIPIARTACMRWEKGSGAATPNPTQGDIADDSRNGS